MEEKERKTEAEVDGQCKLHVYVYLDLRLKERRDRQGLKSLKCKTGLCGGKLSET